MFNKIILLLMGTIFIVTNLNARWTEQHTGSGQLLSINFTPGQLDTGYTCGAGALIYKTTNGGEQWTPKESPIARDFNSICFPTSRTGYICANDSGIIMKSTDGGDIWEYQSLGPNLRFTSIYFATENFGWVCGLSGTIWFTFNGEQWASISTPEPNNFQDIYFADSLTGNWYGWVVGDNGVCYRTYTSGISWIPCTTEVNARLLGVYFTDLRNGWVVGTNKTVLQSNDSGVHWTPVDIPGVPNNISFLSVTFPNSSNGYICGSNGWFAKTTDGGSNWQAYVIEPPRALFDLDFPAGNETGWICGSEEVILKTTDGGAVGIEESNLESNIINSSFVCAPNPFRSNTVIKFGQSFKGNATLKLYDTKGELVRTLKLNKKDEVIWDGRNEVNQKVKSGVYLAELIHNGIAQRQKLIFMD